MDKALLLINKGYSTEQTGMVLQVSMKTIYNWLSKFILNGIGCLYWYHYRGRGLKLKLSKEQKEEMKLSYQKAAFVSDHLDEKKREEWETQTWPKILEARENAKVTLTSFFLDI